MSQYIHLPARYSQLAPLLLACLEDAPKHALDLLTALEQTYITMPELGTFYRLLAYLEYRGWIKPLAPERHLHPYVLTVAGEDALRQFCLSITIPNERIDAYSHDHLRKEKHMRLQRLLLRLYPRAWRERYEEEMLVVLEQHTITPMTIFDLFLGAIDARFDPYYRSQSSPFSLQSVRLTATTFVALLAVFTAALFIWQTQSAPYVTIVNAMMTQGIQVGSDPVVAQSVIGYQIVQTRSDPGYLSNNIAVYALYAEFILLLMANLYFVVRIIKSASPTKRKRLVLLALICLLLSLLAAPVLHMFGLTPFIPTGVNSDLLNRVALPTSVLTVLATIGSGLFIALVRGKRAMQARQWKLLVLAVAIVLLPSLAYYLGSELLNNAIGGWVRPLAYPPFVSFMLLLNALENHLFPFLGFGTLLLAVGTDELQRPFLRRCLRYASVIAMTLIISAVATAIWNVCTRIQVFTVIGSSQRTMLYWNFRGIPVVQDEYILPISLSLLALVLIFGMGFLLLRGYRSLRTPSAQESERQSPAMIQAQQR